MYEFPLIYKRPIPRGYKKEAVKMLNEIETGRVLEFVYGVKQKPGQVGGYKNDRRPVLLVFYDDKEKYIEGINTNYLSRYYLFKLNTILRRFPGITKDGRILYNVVKKTANYAVKKGYRKYIRKNLRNTYLYIMEELPE